MIPFQQLFGKRARARPEVEKATEIESNFKVLLKFGLFSIYLKKMETIIDATNNVFHIAKLGNVGETWTRRPSFHFCWPKIRKNYTSSAGYSTRDPKTNRFTCK